MLIRGILPFYKSIGCQYEVINKTYPAEIGDNKVSIHFPLYPEEYFKDWIKNSNLHRTLLAPEIAKNFRRENESLYWGRPVSYPNKDVEIEMIAISMDYSDADNIDEIAASIFENIGNWESAFLQYCDLSSKQYSYPKPHELIQDTGLSLFTENNPIEHASTSSVKFMLIDHENYLTYEQIEKAISFASKGKELLLEYQMLHASYEARHNLNNRQAIIDACSAMEICLTNIINNYCICHGIDKSIIFEKYRSLWDKVYLLNKIDSSFDNTINVGQIKSNVIELRNAVAHNKNISPNYMETRSLMEKVEEVLKYYHDEFYDI